MGLIVLLFGKYTLKCVKIVPVCGIGFDWKLVELHQPPRQSCCVPHISSILLQMSFS